MEEDRKKELLKKEREKKRRLAPPEDIIDCTEASFQRTLQTFLEVRGNVTINVSKFRVILDFANDKATVGRIWGRGVTDKTECALDYDDIAASLKRKGF